MSENPERVMGIVEQLKELIGYTERPPHCSSCAFFEADDSADNFGPGDRCARNVDVKFTVHETAACKKWELVDMKKLERTK